MLNATINLIRHTGLLIAIDGMQGAGKSTAIYRLRETLSDFGLTIAVSKWNSHREVAPIIHRKKKETSFSRYSWFASHYLDFLLRYEEEILPALERGEIVIADRYWYTSAVRDALKGVTHTLVSAAYSHVIEPDLSLIFVIRPDTAVKRCLMHLKAEGKQLKDLSAYNSGRDLYPDASDAMSALSAYRTEEHRAYIQLAQNSDLLLIDGDASKEHVYKQVEQLVLPLATRHLKGMKYPE